MTPRHLLATDDWPDDARFRWTCEAAWPVREFLRTRPREQVERFLERVDEGRIEVAAEMAVAEQPALCVRV